MKLTLACIARNEETALPLMIESVCGVADEIVVLDTGSTDKTVEVAKRYTDKVFFREWDDSFCNARNACMEHCTGDWVLWLDCDETLAPGVAAMLKPLLEQTPDTVDLILLPIRMCHDDGTHFQRFPGERLQRNRTEWKWHADMHNFLDVPCTPEKRGIADAIEIVHNRSCHTPEQRTARSAQRLQMAETKLATKAAHDPADRRSLFYVAGTYHDSGQHEKALEWFEKYFPVSDFAEERYQAAYLAGQSCLALGRRTEAKTWFDRAVGENWRRAEADVALAEMAVFEGDLDKAEWHYKCASLKAMPLDPMFVEYDKHTWIPYAGLFDVYVRRGEWDKAAQASERALEAGAPLGFAARVSRFTKDHTKFGNHKIAVLVDRGQMDFIQPVIDDWRRQGKDVCAATELADIDEVLAWGPDIIFCEWGGELAVEVTKRKPNTRIIVRLHGYEVYNNAISLIDWLAVDSVICVSQQILGDFLRRCPVADRACRIHVVHGGVSLPDIGSTFAKTGGTDIAMLGFVNDRKNIPLALQILAGCPKHTLHIAGEWQSDELRLYVEHMARELGVIDRLKIYGRVADKWEFLKDKDFILSTSTRETMHYAVAEGMACGLRPVVHNWPSAEEFYPKDCIFNSVQDAVKMLSATVGTDDRIRWREYAEKRLNESAMLMRVNRIVQAPVVGVIGHPSFPDAAEYRLCEALERLGCRTEGENVDAVVVKSSAALPAPEPRATEDVQKIVVWRDDVLTECTPELAILMQKSELVVCGYPDMVDLVKRSGATNAVCMPVVGAALPFHRILNAPKEFDVGFYGAPTDHRSPRLAELGKDLNIAVCDSYDHAELNDFINRCKVMVNLHAWPQANIEFRISECMSAGACVVTERLPECHPFPQDALVETDDVASEVKKLLKDNRRRNRIAKRAHEWVWREFGFDGNVEKIIEAIGL